VPDFIWNKNRLVLEKEALKQNLMKVISKPNKAALNADTTPEAGDVLGSDLKKKQADMQKKMSDVKPTVMVGKGIISGGPKVPGQQFGEAQN
jgi:hypothetical protein